MGTRAPRASRLGRYLVFEPFAEGGMATVSLGRSIGAEGFSRLVAIKRPHPRFASSEESDRMLLDEARLAARIHHPNVVETLDVVRAEGQLLLVMEYVHGVSLASLRAAATRAGRDLPLDILSAIFVGVLRGLHAAHEARAPDGSPMGIVHRDVSPRNIIIGADGVSRVLDFGVAKALRKEALTISGELKGTLAYMSAEQVRGGSVTRQSDVFMAGAVLWEALTGEKPFPGENVGQVLQRLLEHVPPAPSTLRRDVPPKLDAIVLRAMSREPRSRFATAEEMAMAMAEACPPAVVEDVARFVEYVAVDELDERRALVVAAESAAVEPVTTNVPIVAVEPAPPAPKPRPYLLIAAGVGAAAAALAIGATRWSPRSSPPPAATIEPVVSVANAAPIPAPVESTTTIESAPSAEAPLPVTHAPPRAVRPAAGRHSAAALGCDPPYSIDDKGKKHYKARCLP